jgi:hypothetical protein
MEKAPRPVDDCPRASRPEVIPFSNEKIHIIPVAVRNHPNRRYGMAEAIIGFSYLLRPGKASTDFSIRTSRSRGRHGKESITWIRKTFISVFSALFDVPEVKSA